MNKKNIKKIVTIVLSIVLVISGFSINSFAASKELPVNEYLEIARKYRDGYKGGIYSKIGDGEGQVPENLAIKYADVVGYFDYEAAFELYELVNQYRAEYRAKCLAEGKFTEENNTGLPLTMTKEQLSIAMLRAAELALKCSHGTMDLTHSLCGGENLTTCDTAESANQAFINSSGHELNMRSNYGENPVVGIGCFKTTKGQTYWIESFAPYEDGKYGSFYTNTTPTTLDEYKDISNVKCTTRLRYIVKDPYKDGSRAYGDYGSNFEPTYALTDCWHYLHPQSSQYKKTYGMFSYADGNFYDVSRSSVYDASTGMDTWYTNAYRIKGPTRLIVYANGTWDTCEIDSSKVKFKSSDDSKVTIDEEGYITIKESGNYELPVYAEYNGEKFEYTVKVIESISDYPKVYNEDITINNRNYTFYGSGSYKVSYENNVESYKVENNNNNNQNNNNNNNNNNNQNNNGNNSSDSNDNGSNGSDNKPQNTNNTSINSKTTTTKKAVTKAPAASQKIVKPKGTVINKLVKGKKKITVKWKKAAGINGYEIHLATDKKFKKNKKTVNVANAKTTSKTVKKLKSKKKYYVRIRTYKTVKGKKVYSSWSKIKTVKTK